MMSERKHFSSEFKTEMSISIPLQTLSDEQRLKISDDLSISTESEAQKFKRKRFGGKGSAETVDVYDICESSGLLYLPFFYAQSQVHLCPQEYSKFPPLTEGVNFASPLRDSQKAIKKEAVDILNKQNVVMISAYPGFGKTCTSIYLACLLRLRTIILVHRVVLMQQWVDSIKKFVPLASVGILKPSSKDKQELEFDFVVVNALNVPKFPRDFLSQFGLVIVDEAHLILSKVLSQSLFYLCPRFLIGLSATPYRTDGMDRQINLFFGEARVSRQLYKKHTVYRVDTPLKPEAELDSAGKVIWDSILSQQASSQERDGIILEILSRHSERNFLILCKRIEHVNRLNRSVPGSAVFMESQTTFDRDARVLIGTTSKLGVGFDHPKLDALILAADVEEYFIQYLGRVFRRDDVEPIVFDLVDDHPILKRHFSTRKKVYISIGGTVVKF